MTSELSDDVAINLTKESMLFDSAFTKLLSLPSKKFAHKLKSCTHNILPIPSVDTVKEMITNIPSMFPATKLKDDRS